MNKKTKRILTDSNHKTKILIISCFLLAGTIVFCLFFADKNIRLSRKSGFYDEEFDLRVFGGGSASILHYTLDGTEPTEDSPVVDGKIHIADPSDAPNVYSMRMDISQMFFMEDDDENPYDIPSYNIDKCVPLRVASFDKNGTKTNETYATYWIGYRDRLGYDGLYTLSIVTDPKNLFDRDNGIYVTGRLFDDFLAENDEWNFRDNLPANYNEKGPEWERPVHFTLMGPDKKLLYEANSGIRIKGLGSRRNAQKSFKLYAREEYGGSDRFSLPLFGYEGGISKIGIFGGGQDQFIKNKDLLINSIIEDAGLKIDTCSMQPANVFIDGEYWGVYYLTEEITSDYVKEHYGIDKRNTIILKSDEVLWGDAEDKKDYYDIMYEFAEQYNVKDLSVYEQMCNYYIDIDSYVDYVATEIYIANADWPSANVACWRARESSNQGYADGKWRWILFDVNYTGILRDPDKGNFVRFVEKDPLLAALMSNEEFQQKMYAKLVDLENNVFSWENVSRYIDPWKELMEEPLKKSSLRFTDTEEMADIDGRIAEIRYFCENRGSEIRRQFDEIVNK